MGRGIYRLTDRRVQTIKRPGRHADGGGLYLVVEPSGSKRWAFMSWKRGRQIEIGLGGVLHVGLAKARDGAAECREAVAKGRDPRGLSRRVPEATNATFGVVAKDMVASLEGGWRNTKHRAQWQMTLRVYAASLHDKHVADVTTADVVAALNPIWLTKNETASRLRGRIERVLDAAKAKGLRSGENPARWRGHLDHLLPKRSRLQRGHHPAMPWQKVPAFVARLRALSSISARCLEFVILTAARQGEVVRSVRDGQVMGMTWEEIDEQARVWTVPANRMKGAREHRVPLARRSFEIVEEMSETRLGPFVFPGHIGSKPLSEMALELLMRRMGAKPWTVHGFRSSFRDWAGEATNFPREIAEAALSHTVGDVVERAYRRGDALERRRELMESWESFICRSTPQA